MENNSSFEHLFGGWMKATAHRHINPDGSPGGIIADSAVVDEFVIVPETATIWPSVKVVSGAFIGDRASIGDNASIGSGAELTKDDWLFAAGPQGSQNALATAVWSAGHGLRWWVGCQHGISTETLRERITRDYAEGSPERDDYLYLVEMVETHPGLARALTK